ncbi:hypothetical protein [Falsibacillus albus]|uniref:Uncharacterized protein n=1 Tax=Falsibacillus albus TaxID=2478915 RepID=A0A3L7K0K0_9BACI|nr:hypothetical protein [Falsibacillus albus]RLQ96115.1 hypothetical protein D9X91_07420 [Falsibacillus albus]
MNNKELEEKIVQNYQKDENMMILVFAQWCINNDLDPEAMYKEAYPSQAENHALKNALELTVPKKEAGEIPDHTLLGVLDLFGNNELAMIAADHMTKRKKW